MERGGGGKEISRKRRGGSLLYAMNEGARGLQGPARSTVRRQNRDYGVILIVRWEDRG